MRKFQIKNRQKRKYTKKSEEIPSFSFSKTAYSMMPLLVMLIAFMSTMIISAPVRDAFTNISFTFELPQFSLTNPLTFFQTLITDFSQIGMVIWAITQLFVGAISQGFTNAGGNITNDSFSLVNFLALCGNSIWSSCLFAFQQLVNGISILGQFFNYLAFQCINIFRLFITFIVNSAIAIDEVLSTIIQTSIHQVFLIGNAITHFTFVASITVFNFILFLCRTALMLIISTATLVGSFIARIFLAIVHTIEIPFKIVYAFLLQFKPYIDVFGKHVQMSGSDFSNMFNSIGKIASLIGTSK